MIVLYALMLSESTYQGASSGTGQKNCFEKAYQVIRKNMK